MFEFERAHLQKLPAEPYKVAIYHRAQLHRDCHLSFEKNFYSAPHSLRGKELDIWATTKSIEIFSEGERVAMHVRGSGRSSYFTDTNHYPPAQQAYAEEDVQKVIDRAVKVGSETEKLIRGLLEGPSPLRYYRRCQGILALGHRYGSSQLESACGQGNAHDQPYTQYLERVIKVSQGSQRQKTGAITNRAFNPHLRGVESIH
jgi:hypothetical protein